MLKKYKINENEVDRNLEFVKEYGYALKHVPEDKKTLEICLAAVKRYGFALQYVPEDKRTPEICLEAVENNVFALKYVPEDKITDKIINCLGIATAERILDCTITKL